MGARKNELVYKIVDATDASVSFDTKANPTNVNWLDNAGITVQWTGNPVGTMQVYVSNDKVDAKAGRTVTNWVALDFGTSIVVDNTNPDGIVINMNQLPFVWLALGFTSTSGTGTISAQLAVKEV